MPLSPCCLPAAFSAFFFPCMPKKRSSDGQKAWKLSESCRKKKARMSVLLNRADSHWAELLHTSWSSYVQCLCFAWKFVVPVNCVKRRGCLLSDNDGRLLKLLRDFLCVDWGNVWYAQELRAYSHLHESIRLSIAFASLILSKVLF